MIDRSDDTFAFRQPSLPPGLAESVARHGVLCPVVVRERGGALQVVSGRRRFDAAARAGLRDIPCLVFGREELPDLAALRLILEENRFGSGFTAVEAGKLMALFGKQGLTADEISSDIAPLLGVPAGRESVASHMALSSMDTSITAHPLARDGALLSLAKLPADAARRLWEGWMVPARPSVQEVRQAVEWIEDLAVSSGIDPARVVDDLVSASPARQFLKSLRSRRFPLAAAIEDKFAISCAALPKGVRARMTSTDAVEFTISASDAARLSAAAMALSGGRGPVEAVFKAAAGE